MLLYSSHRKAGNETIDKEIVHDRDGDAGYEATGHQRAPEVDVAVHQERAA
jgi:hypothetical protein